MAKQLGAYNGRKKTLTPERAGELVHRAENGVPKAVLAHDYGISRETGISTSVRPGPPRTPGRRAHALVAAPRLPVPRLGRLTESSLSAL
jgi:hypothetical protein